MIGNFSEESKKLLNRMLMEAVNLNHEAVGSEHLILAYLSLSDLNELKELGLDYKKYRNELIKVMGNCSKIPSFNFYTPLLIRVIENTVMDSKDRNKEITPDDLFCNVILEGEGLGMRVMQELDLDISQIFKCFKPTTKPPEGAFTDICHDLNEEARLKLIDPVFERDDIINRIFEIFKRRTKNNTLLIGEAGVGKTAIVEGLTRKIVEGNVPECMKNINILGLDMASAVAGTKYRGEFEEKLKKILSEVEYSNYVLFIDEIHTMVGAGGAEGAIDASNIFKPALARGKIKCIGATTIDEYKKYIEPDSALTRRFHPVIIEEPSVDATIKIMNGIKPLYEDYHGVKISDEIINYIVESTSHIIDRYYPDKAIDVLDEACAKKVLSGDSNELKSELTKINNLKREAVECDDFKRALALKKEWQIVKEKLIKHQKKRRVNITKYDVDVIINNKTKIKTTSSNIGF